MRPSQPHEHPHQVLSWSGPRVNLFLSGGMSSHSNPSLIAVPAVLLEFRTSERLTNNERLGRKRYHLRVGFSGAVQIRQLPAWRLCN